MIFLIQKVIKVGNSAAVTLPKDFLKSAKVKVGDQVHLEIDDSVGAAIISAQGNPYKSVSPDVAQWTKGFIERNRRALKELANL